MDPLNSELFDILACPHCKSELRYNKDKTALKCTNCKREYLIKEGIPILLI